MLIVLGLELAALDLNAFVQRSHLDIPLSKAVFLLLLPLLPSLLLVHSTHYNYYFTVTTTFITTTSTATTTVTITAAAACAAASVAIATATSG
eukprot:2886518-Pyramimonas_sp.AAC.1